MEIKNYLWNGLLLISLSVALKINPDYDLLSFFAYGSGLFLCGIWIERRTWEEKENKNDKR